MNACTKLEDFSVNASPRAGVRVVVVIPAYKPDTRLLTLVAELGRCGFQAMIVVDDGSGPRCQDLFQRLSEFPGCHVVHHAVNLGKGRAIKTGLNSMLLRFPEALGVVTADADGQHAVDDICRLAGFLVKHPQSFAIGVRQFHRLVPFRSRFGNRITSLVFGCLTGKPLHDTQCGLRAIPADLIPPLLHLGGERYDFETGMLFYAAKNGVDMHEMPIRTIYIGANESSHFRPLRDSAQIYYKLAEFYASSAFAALLDLIAFAVAFSLTGRLLFSFLVGRILIAAFVNFNINRRYVFQSKVGILRALFRYYATFAIFAAASYLSIRALRAGGFNPIFAKACVESLLSVLSFAVQGIYVFAERRMRAANAVRAATSL